MSTRSDVLRSLIRSAADRVSNRVMQLGPFARAKRVLEEVRAHRGVVSDRALTSAVAHAPGVRAASVTAHRGAVRIDAAFDNGEAFAFSLVPEGARFAPRGAKEITFRVEPPELAAHTRVHGIASAINAAIAFAIWGFMFGKRAAPGNAPITERDGIDRLRSDLRSASLVREMLQSPLGALIDMLEVEHIRADEGSLEIRIKLPDIGF